MKISIRKMLVLLAIVLSLTVVQAVWARDCNVTVSGDVTAIYDLDNAIEVGETIVYGIPLDYLANKLKIVLEVDDYVVITAHQCPLTDKLSACTLKVNVDDVINLRGPRNTK